MQFVRGSEKPLWIWIKFTILLIIQNYAKFLANKKKIVELVDVGTQTSPMTTNGEKGVLLSYSLLDLLRSRK